MLLRRRSLGACRHGVPRHRRSAMPGRDLRRRNFVGAASLDPAAGAPAAGRPGRVVALDRFPHHPTQELPQRQVRVDVRQQPLSLLQPAPGSRRRSRLELPSPRAQRPYPVGGYRQLRVHPGQQRQPLRQPADADRLHARCWRGGREPGADRRTGRNLRRIAAGQAIHWGRMVRDTLGIRGKRYRRGRPATGGPAARGTVSIDAIQANT